MRSSNSTRNSAPSQAVHLFAVSLNRRVAIKEGELMRVTLQLMRSSKCEDGIFKYKILYKYSSYVQELNFDFDDEDALRYLLSVVSPRNFPAVTRLATSAEIAECLFGDLVDYDNEGHIEDVEGYIRSTFLTLAERIESPEMRDFDSVQAANFLSCFTRLRRIHFDQILETPTSVDNPLPAALALHDLHSLSFVHPCNLGDSWMSAAWPFASSLINFELRRRTSVPTSYGSSPSFHQRWSASPSPLATSGILSPREQPPSSGVPSLAFELWRLVPRRPGRGATAFPLF